MINLDDYIIEIVRNSFDSPITEEQIAGLEGKLVAVTIIENILSRKPPTLHIGEMIHHADPNTGYWVQGQRPYIAVENPEAALVILNKKGYRYYSGILTDLPLTENGNVYYEIEDIYVLNPEIKDRVLSRSYRFQQKAINYVTNFRSRMHSTFNSVADLLGLPKFIESKVTKNTKDFM